LAKQIKLDDKTNSLLDIISIGRKETGALIKTKQDIVKELIIAAAKKELPKDTFEGLGFK
jgi:hypothetical protein